jgi:hypothetical protein
MTANRATEAAPIPALVRTPPVVDVMAVLVAQQQQLDDLTSAIAAQHQTLVSLVDHLSPSETSRSGTGPSHIPATRLQP